MMTRHMCLVLSFQMAYGAHLGIMLAAGAMRWLSDKEDEMGGHR